MKQLTMKARSGVTLVELLVVILIVTILSVSLLPLLKPYIEEAKYAAEPIPVLANLQTKINLYQYDKDKLPGTSATNDLKYVATWYDAGTNTTVVWTQAMQKVPDGAPEAVSGFEHFASRIDVDWQDLLGRRMNPSHFKYANLKGDGSSSYGYAVGVFGDGNGLGRGTGHAVLTIVNTEKNMKIVGTWSRYKPKSDVQISFNPDGNPDGGVQYCHLPAYTTMFSSAATPEMLISFLTQAGWEINEEALKK